MMPRLPRLYLAALAFYSLLAFILLHPLLFHNGTHVAGYDYFNYNWNFWWIRHALATPGLNVYESDFVFYPTLNNFGYHALTLIWYPLWALVEPLTGTLTAVNLIIVTGCVLNGFILFIFLRSEGIPVSFALIGGAALQVLPISRYFYYNTHLNLMDWFWLPAHLLLWKQIVASVEAGSWRRALLWSVIMGLGVWGLGLTDLQFPIFTAFLLVPYGLLTLWRSPRRIYIAACGVVVVAIGIALLWFAGPLPYMLRFRGTLVPGAVEDRPGIPFPTGFLTMSDRWWSWDSPSLGAFVTIILILTLVVSFRYLHRPARLRWFWFAVMLPPLILAMGPTLNLFGAEIPLPYRLLHGLTNGNLRMPWRLAPIYVIAALTFTGLTWTALRPRRNVSRLFALTGVFFLLALDSRLYETGPIEPVLPAYDFYAEMGREQGDPYDDYVVLEVPTGAGSGEVLFGDAHVITYQYYGMTHGKRMVNGFVSRAPIEVMWPIHLDDPMLAWLGQRRPLEPQVVESQLRDRIFNWPIGYVVIHRDRINASGPTQQEIIGYFNALDDLLCPYIQEGDALVYRTRWHPDGCPPRTPPKPEPGVYVIDIGSPGDERFIGWGWHWPEDIFGLTLRWTGEYPQTQLYLDLPPADYDLSLSAQSFWQNRRLTVRINDQSLGDPVMVTTDALHEFTFSIPAEAIADGQHLAITLDYDGVTIPVEVGQSADTRRLAIAVDWLRFTRRES